MLCFYPAATFVVVKVADVYYVDVHFVVYSSKKLLKYSKVKTVTTRNSMTHSENLKERKR